MNLPKETKAKTPSFDKKTLSEDITHITQDLINLYKKEPPYELPVDLLQFSHFFDIYAKILSDIENNPIKIIKIHKAFFAKANKLYFYTLNNFFDKFLENPKNASTPTLPPKITEPNDDRRFLDPIWKEQPQFEFLKEAYYLITEYTLKWLNSLNTIDKKTIQQLHFYIKNYLDFLSPTNFILLNPDVIRNTIESGGENLLKGYKNFLQDLVLNNGRLNISKTDHKAFKVGKNLAITKGKVIFQNDLMQLIQYEATTNEVYKTPILFIPPWINKYYILDLNPENSMVKWLIEQGFTVYMISWVNPGRKLAQKGFEDYMKEGPLDALDIIQKTADVKSVHMVGYCIGGTLLACTLGYMKKMKDHRAATATFLMTLIDFRNPGELGVFIDEKQLQQLDKVMEEKGYLDGRILDMTFNLLRPNDLVWPYFINNYLQGHEPKAFDLLYWNGDSSNLPQKMYSFYLRNMYLRNRLIKQGGIELLNVPINLKKVTVPSFFLASETDHISLWKSVYAGTQVLGSVEQFVLSGSGHVRGAINPPSKNKYNYFINEKYGVKEAFPKNPGKWLTQAKEYKGSWWPYWAKWLAIDAEKVPARVIGTGGLPILEDAPGTYVMKKL